MKIYFEYIGLLHIEGVRNKAEIIIEDNLTIDGLYVKLGIHEEHRKFISSFVNGEEKKKNYKINDGDKVKLFMPTGGG